MTSDLHVHPWRACSADGGLDRLSDGLVALDRTLNAAREHGAGWLCLGDMKESKGLWNQTALAGILGVLDRYPNVTKIMVTGNHDGHDGLDPFRLHARVIAQPFVDNDLGIAVWPGSAPARELPAFLDSCTNIRTLFGHALIHGAKLGPDDVQGPGVETTVLRRFGCTVLGDVHKGQWYRPRGPVRAPRWGWVAWDERAPIEPEKLAPGSVLYPGSPYQQTWGERADAVKGALLVDFDASTVRLIPIEGLPRFVRVEYPRESITEEQAQGNFVEIVIHEPVSPEHFDHVRAVARWCILTPAPTLPMPVRRADREFHAAMSLRDLLASYCAMRPGPVSASRLLDAGLKLVAP